MSVTLVSSDTATATVPASQMVVAGQTKATFSVMTVAVASVKLVTITATLNGMVVADLTVNPAVTGPAIQMVVNQSVPHQKWLAWRATATGPTFMGIAGDLTGTTLLTNILNDVVDLGITGYRVELFAGNLPIPPPPYSFAAEDARIKQIVLPTQTRVTANGEPFSSYVTVIGKFPTNWPWASNATEYGNMAAAFLNNYGGASGILYTPNYWVTVNEPANNGFVCCTGTGNEPQFQNALATKLQAMGSSVKLEMPDTSTPDAAYVSGDFAALTLPGQVGLIAWHNYDYNTGGPAAPSFAGRNANRTLAQSQVPALATAATEICCGPGWNGSYDSAAGHGGGQPISWARDIFWNMTEGDISVWEPLAIMFPCAAAGCPSGGQDSIVLEPDLSGYHKYQSFYALRQFAHYIRPGFTRVDMICGNCTNDINGAIGQNVKPVAWLSPGNKLVLVVVNDQTQAQNIAITISGLPANTMFTVTGVDPTQPANQAFGNTTTNSAGTLNFPFPAQAILTFVQQ